MPSVPGELRLRGEKKKPWIPHQQQEWSLRPAREFACDLFTCMKMRFTEVYN